MDYLLWCVTLFCLYLLSIGHPGMATAVVVAVMICIAVLGKHLSDD